MALSSHQTIQEIIRMDSTASGESRLSQYNKST